MAEAELARILGEYLQNFQTAHILLRLILTQGLSRSTKIIRTLLNSIADRFRRLSTIKPLLLIEERFSL